MSWGAASGSSKRCGDFTLSIRAGAVRRPHRRQRQRQVVRRCERGLAGLMEPSWGGRVRIRGRRPPSRARGRARPRTAGARARQPAGVRRPDRARARRARHRRLTALGGQRSGGAHRRAPGSARPRASAATSRPHELSRGMRQKTQLACALIRPGRSCCSSTSPWSGIDPPSQEPCCTSMLLEGAVGRGCAILLTTHQLGFADGLADRGMLLQRGRGDRRRRLRRPSWPARGPPGYDGASRLSVAAGDPRIAQQSVARGGACAGPAPPRSASAWRHDLH